MFAIIEISTGKIGQINAGVFGIFTSKLNAYKFLLEKVPEAEQDKYEVIKISWIRS